MAKARGDPGIAAAQIDRPKLDLNLIDKRGDMARVAQIARHRESPDLGSYSRQTSSIPVRYRHSRTPTRRSPRQRRANPARRTGDKDHFTRNLHVQSSALDQLSSYRIVGQSA